MTLRDGADALDSLKHMVAHDIAKHAENFISWDQIEPLVTPGMTAGELEDAILALAGLSPERYGVITAIWAPTFVAAFRAGATIHRRDSPEWINADGEGDPAEVIA